MHTNNQGAFYMRKKDKATRNSKVWIQAIYHNIIMLSLSAYYTLLHFFFKHGGYVKCETTVDKKYSKDLEQDKLEIAPRFTISNAKEKKSRCHKRKTDFPRWRVQRN